ncbi:MAG: hypothetical protein EBW47_12650, partial [Betaproteobacteria bacterium]|nr:hypothetical protein [Betaproteobacteria bacterium]
MDEAFKSSLGAELSLACSIVDSRMWRCRAAADPLVATKASSAALANPCQRCQSMQGFRVIEVKS